MARPSSRWREITLDAVTQASEEWRACDPDDLETKRRIIASQIRHLTEALRQLGASSEILPPLQALGAALTDVAAGIQHELLSPRKAGRQKTPVSVRRARLFAVAAVMWLEDRGMTPVKALEFVAAEFARAGHKGHGRKPVTSAMIKKWRENAFQGGDRRSEEELVRLKAKEWTSKNLPIGREKDAIREIAEGLLKSSLNP